MPIRRDNVVSPNTSSTEEVLRQYSSMSGYEYTMSIDLEKIDSKLIRNLSLALAREQEFLPLWRIGEA